MFSHIFVGSNDIERSKKFYDATLGALGVPPGVVDPPSGGGRLPGTGDIMVMLPFGATTL